MSHPLSWIEISRANLTHNIRTFRKLIGPDRILCPAVKANAYGHGLRECAPIMVKAGADWLGVNALFEAEKLRKSGIKVPIYIMGYIPFEDLPSAVKSGFHFVIYNIETLQELAKITKKLKKTAHTHLKLETGIFRQGVMPEQLEEILNFYVQHPLVKLEGLSMHFANIEDTTDHSYALYQLENFATFVKVIQEQGFNPSYIHSANTAATLLFPKTHFTMVRTGIGNYGLWPSKETQLSTTEKIALKPALTWKTRVAQIKQIPQDSFIGYGCTYKTTHPSTIAIIPVGYYDSYDRGLSNLGYVLIRGHRAPIRGRVCMNMMMVEVTHIPKISLEDEVVLLGKQGQEELTADQMATWLGTISYEITTRISESIPRIVVK